MHTPQSSFVKSRVLSQGIWCLSRSPRVVSSNLKQSHLLDNPPWIYICLALKFWALGICSPPHPTSPLERNYSTCRFYPIIPPSLQFIPCSCQRAKIHENFRAKIRAILVQYIEDQRQLVVLVSTVWSDIILRRESLFISFYCDTVVYICIGCYD